MWTSKEGRAAASQLPVPTLELTDANRVAIERMHAPPTARQRLERCERLKEVLLSQQMRVQSAVQDGRCV